MVLLELLGFTVIEVDMGFSLVFEECAIAL
jgi:hypothetical protein